MAFDTSMSSFLELYSLFELDFNCLVEIEIVFDMSCLIGDTSYFAGVVWLLVWAYEISCDCNCDYDCD